MHTTPTLSSKGWITDVNDRLDRIITYYFSTNPSQSIIYRGRIFSVQQAIFKCNDDLDSMVALIQSDLTTVLTRNFPEGATVEVTYGEIGDDISKINIYVTATVINNGVNYDLAKAVDSVQSLFTKAIGATREYGNNI